MKATPLLNIKRHILKLSAAIVLITTVTQTANAQIDHYYGLNNKGFRLAVGVGAATLYTHYNSNPAQIVGLGSLEYDFNPFLTVGVEGQGGYLKGVDNVNHQYYKTSKNQFLAANVFVKAAVGQFVDFDTNNNFQDALKRLYLGVGVGKIRTDVQLTQNPALAESTPPESVMKQLQMWQYSVNLGTNIDLHGILGLDRLSLNPNFQFTYVNDYYLDGFRTSVQYSHLKGFYNLTSLKLKYKF